MRDRIRGGLTPWLDAATGGRCLPERQLRGVLGADCLRASFRVARARSCVLVVDLSVMMKGV